MENMYNFRQFSIFELKGNKYIYSSIHSSVIFFNIHFFQGERYSFCIWMLKSLCVFL